MRRRTADLCKFAELVVIGLRQQDFCLIAFENTHAAISAQRALDEAGLQAYVMPTPREITAGCGLSIRFPPKEYAEAKRVMAALTVSADQFRFYRMTYDDEHRQVAPMETA